MLMLMLMLLLCSAGPQSWLETLAAYHTRHYQSPSGQEAARWLFDTVTEVASANPAITVSQFQHSFDQPLLCNFIKYAEKILNNLCSAKTSR